MSAVRQGPYAVLSENVFSNCLNLVCAVKADQTPFLMESNVLFRCASVRSTYGSWGEWPDAEFRFNVVWCEPGSGVPFLEKNGRWGLHGENVLVHHNTFVNVSRLALVDDNANIAWQPQFFDNLIVLDPADAGGTVFENGQTAFAEGNASSFLTGGAGCFRNNAWLAPGGLWGGAATEVAGYDPEAGCLVTNNIGLSAAPIFVSTDPESPHFCRPAPGNGAWAGAGSAWTDGGAYPDWIGAKPVAAVPGWTAGPMSSTGDTICTDGTLVYAYAVQNVTVGDVSFVRTTDLNSADMVSVSPGPEKLSGGSFLADGATGDYAIMLSDGWSWGSDGDGNYLAYSLTLSGLEAGKTYLVQLVCHRQSKSMLVSANGSDPVHVHGDDEANYKYGASIVGVFTAAASTENVVVTYTNQTGDRPLNAIQVRELSAGATE